MPTRLDVDGGIAVTRALGPVSIATDTDTDSATVDLNAFPGYRVFLVAGTAARTDGTFTFSLRQSADDSSYAAVTPYSGAVTAISTANVTREACYAPTSRYLKVRCTSASTTSGALIAAYLLLIPPAL